MENKQITDSNYDFLGLIFMSFILPYFEPPPKEIIELYEKYKDKDLEDYKDEVTPIIQKYYDKMKEEFKLLKENNI